MLADVGCHGRMSSHLGLNSESGTYVLLALSDFPSWQLSLHHQEVWDHDGDSISHHALFISAVAPDLSSDKSVLRLLPVLEYRRRLDGSILFTDLA